MARPGHLYVLDFGEGQVKVGYSKKPENRSLLFGRAPILHVSEWSDSADMIERAAHKLLDMADLRVKNEVFSATLSQAVDAIERAFSMLSRGEISPPRRSNRRKKMVTMRLDADLLDDLDAWIAEQEFPVSKTWIIETALTEFFERRGFTLPK